MDVIGGGVLVAAAAALWIAYLLPSWLRRRQYLDTERNAVRLQQTLRILAETAETPEAVRVEATAREVASSCWAIPRDRWVEHRIVRRNQPKPIASLLAGWLMPESARSASVASP